jgi:hypothetical protein
MGGGGYDDGTGGGGGYDDEMYSLTLQGTGCDRQITLTEQDSSLPKPNIQQQGTFTLRKVKAKVRVRAKTASANYHLKFSLYCSSVRRPTNEDVMIKPIIYGDLDLDRGREGGLTKIKMPVLHHTHIHEHDYHYNLGGREKYFINHTYNFDSTASSGTFQRHDLLMAAETGKHRQSDRFTSTVPPESRRQGAVQTMITRGSVLAGISPAGYAMMKPMICGDLDLDRGRAGGVPAAPGQLAPRSFGGGGGGGGSGGDDEGQGQPPPYKYASQQQTTLWERSGWSQVHEYYSGAQSGCSGDTVRKIQIKSNTESNKKIKKGATMRIYNEIDKKGNMNSEDKNNIVDFK